MRTSHETPEIHIMANKPNGTLCISTYRRDQQPEKAGAYGRSIFSEYKQDTPLFIKTFLVYVFW